MTAEASTLVVAFDLGVAVDDDDMGLDVVVVVDAQRPILIGLPGRIGGEEREGVVFTRES